MPLSTLNDIYINSIEVAVLACIILLASFKLLTARPVWIFLTIPFSLLFGILHCHAYLQRTDSPHLTIYPDKSELAVDVISAFKTQTTLNPQQADYYTMRAARLNRLQYYASKTERLAYQSIHSETKAYSIKITTKDSAPLYIMYVNSSPGQFTIPTGKFAFIILAKALDYRTAQRLKNQCDRLNLDVHDMRKQGAFKLTLL